MFNDAKYKAHLDMLIDKAYEEYKHVSRDIPKLQSRFLRTYLWLGSILVAFELNVFIKIIHRKETIWFLNGPIGGYFYFFASLSILSSFITFLIGLDSLRGKGHKILPFGDFMNLAQLAYESAFSENSRSLEATILNALNDEISRQSALCSQLGQQLRNMSYLLLTSVAMAITAFITLIGQ